MTPLHAQGKVPPPGPAVVDEAIAWLVRLQSGEAQPADWEACQRWRAAQPTHALAWERLQGVRHRFAALPDGPQARVTLEDARRQMGRRQALRVVGVVFMGGATAWLARPALPLGRWMADASTGVGEQRQIRLADGTLLWLDTRTAVDVQFSASERRLVLREGRIALTTGADPQARGHRPLLVQTSHGTARALGTRFQVQYQPDATQVDVFEHAVELSPAGGAPSQRLQAGQTAWLEGAGVRGIQPSLGDQDAWSDGLLVAREMPLGRLVAELARYRAGWLACDEEIAPLRISGVFSLTDTDRTLELVEKTLPIQVQRRSRYWVRLRAG